MCIIGGGCAGIGAARHLYESGMKDFVVLEGRKRLGGRLHGEKLKKKKRTVDGVCDDDDEYVSIQLGANWIHGLDESINPLYTAGGCL